MSNKATYTLKNDKALDADINRLDVNVGLKLMRKAGREAARPMVTLMKAGANVSTTASSSYTAESREHMRDSIKITTSSGSRSSASRFLKISVGPSGKHTQKAVAQEFGTAKQSAQPFVKPAGKQARGLQQRILIRAINRELKNVTRGSRK